MLTGIKKISMRQAVILFLTLTFSPTVRHIPSYTAKYAKQAAWLTPVMTLILMSLLAFVWNYFYKTYKDNTLMDIYCDITGKVIGTILAFVHLAWMIILAAVYLRYFIIKLVGSIMPLVSISFLLITILLMLFYALRYGLILIARLNELIFPIILVTFILIVLMLLPNIKWDFLVPLTYRDILPVLRGGIASVGILSSFTFLFIFGDSINNKEKTGKLGFQTALFLFCALTILLAWTIGTLSHTVTEKTLLPFLTSVKQISLFNVLEKIEPVVVSLWVMSDFVLISFFILATFRIIKHLFKNNNSQSLISISMVFFYFLTLSLVSSTFEIENLSSKVILPVNIILGIILPVIMFIIGKLRRKI